MLIERLARLLERSGAERIRARAVAAWIDRKFWWVIGAVVVALAAADFAVMSFFYR
jgi:hypothetical protein